MASRTRASPAPDNMGSCRIRRARHLCTAASNGLPAPCTPDVRTRRYGSRQFSPYPRVRATDTVRPRRTVSVARGSTAGRGQTASGSGVFGCCFWPPAFSGREDARGRHQLCQLRVRSGYKPAVPENVQYDKVGGFGNALHVVTGAGVVQPEMVQGGEVAGARTAEPLRRRYIRRLPQPARFTDIPRRLRECHFVPQGPVIQPTLARRRSQPPVEIPTRSYPDTLTEGGVEAPGDGRCENRLCLPGTSVPLASHHRAIPPPPPVEHRPELGLHWQTCQCRYPLSG